jgi:hypothetical protein
MSHVKEIWDIEITRWWPSGSESGEPDMPHDTYFARELPLYVDFIDFDQQWHVPQHQTRKYIFDPAIGDDSLSKSKKMIDQLCRTAEAGLYNTESLSSFNEIFKIRYLSDKSDIEEIKRLYLKASDRLGNFRFEGSALSKLPLYSFV